MQRQNDSEPIRNNTGGFAVVEATFIFPIMLMVFLALLMLAMYLPQRAMLQRATQMAATALAVEMSDTWVRYDANARKYTRHSDYAALQSAKGGVYSALFRSIFSKDGRDGQKQAEEIVRSLFNAENPTVIADSDSIIVDFELINYVVNKEVVVTATRVIKLPVEFPLISFTGDIELVVTSKAVVQNADELVRNVDMAFDVAEKLGAKKFIDGFKKAGESITGFFKKA